MTVLPGTAASFAERLRAAHGLVGYWIGSDNAAMTERIARIGFDYVCLDAQHGLLDAAACLRGLFAIDAAAPVSGTAGLVRVSVNRPEEIGRALDAGAAGVIVPLVNSAAEAVAAARACRYPPNGIRSYGPVRSGLRIGPDPDRRLLSRPGDARRCGERAARCPRGAGRSGDAGGAGPAGLPRPGRDSWQVRACRAMGHRPIPSAGWSSFQVIWLPTAAA